MADDSHDIPAGFQPLVPGGTWLGHAGPLYQRDAADGGVVIGLRLAQKHTNMRGIAHGGMLVTLADSALGRNMHLTRKPSAPMVSVNLSTDFLGAARVGDWLEAHVQVRKHGARLSFAECELRVGDKVVVRCSGVFAVVEPVANKEVPEG
ncbi:MAG: PaaI family thioesterase [Rhizobacter sp.]|nr:PaaI family thioesterase [Rhizobacter sp.]